MRRALAIAVVLNALVIPLGIVTAHSDLPSPAVQVVPADVAAGGTVVFRGAGLEPDSDRDLVLAGDGMVVDLGIVETDAAGTFSEDVQVPGHLPTGAFELRAVGGETLTAALHVAGVAAGSSTSPTTASKPSISPDPTWLEQVAFALFVAAFAVAGSLVAWKARRLSQTLEEARAIRSRRP